MKEYWAQRERACLEGNLPAETTRPLRPWLQGPARQGLKIISTQRGIDVSKAIVSTNYNYDKHCDNNCCRRWCQKLLLWPPLVSINVIVLDMMVKHLRVKLKLRLKIAETTSF